VRRFCFAASLLVALGAARAASAWSAAAHEAIGAAADRRIAGTHAASEVRALLDGESLATASVWADCARGVVRNGRGFRYRESPDHPECARFETTPGEAALVDFVARNAARCSRSARESECGHESYHFANVAIQRDRYAGDVTGASDHDLIAATRAAIAVLRGQRPPEPFAIASKREALLLLAHYVGDLHQPLHVAAVYLSDQGRLVDPDATRFDARTATRGGNALLVGSKKLHAIWDGVAQSIRADVRKPRGAAAGAAVPKMHGDPASWPSAWATDSLRAGRSAFEGVAFGARSRDGTWRTTLPSGYGAHRAELQKQQLIAAGAHLAQLLEAIWP
jgi:hypothetical protein